jgi:hypothetical protein
MLHVVLLTLLLGLGAHLISDILPRKIWEREGKEKCFHLYINTESMVCPLHILSKIQISIIQYFWRYQQNNATNISLISV